MDLSQLSNEDLIALNSGDLSKLSDNALRSLSGQPVPAQPKSNWERGKAMAQQDLDRLPTNQDRLDFLVGATGLMRGAANQIGDFVGAGKLGEKIWPSDMATGGKYETVGRALDPVALAIGSTTGYSPVLGNGLKQGAINFAKNVAAGAGTGGTIGALSDKGTADEGALAGGIAGGLAGPLIEGAGKAYGAVKNVIDPWLEGGVQRAASKTVKELAGPKRGALITALDNPQQYVNRSPMTAGEAAVPVGSAEFSGLEKALRPALPSDYDAIARAQNQARIDALRTIGQDKAALDAAIAQRSQIADPLYAAARSGGNVVNTTQILSNIDDLVQRNPGNRELLSELSNIKNGLMGQNGPRTDAEQVASVMDGLKTAIADEKNKFIQGHLVQLKNDIAAAIPGYSQAQQAFAQASRPVNQMQVGQYLENKLVAPLAEYGDNLAPRAALYAQALRDAPGTIKQSVGKSPLTDLGQVLDPSQVATVQNVGNDLGRSAENARLGSLGIAKARQILGQIEPPIPSIGMVSPKYSVLRAASNRLHGLAQGKSIDYLAEAMKDPKKMADLLRMSDPNTQATINMLLQKFQPPAVGGMVSASQGD